MRPAARIFIITTEIILFISLAAAAFTPHAPIVILGNHDFTRENGVIAGGGTADDPFIIAGWKIELSDGDRYGIIVEGASAYFIIRHVLIEGAIDSDGAAIRLGFVTAATVESSIILRSMNGIEITSSTGVTLNDNTIRVTGFGLQVLGDRAADFHHDIDGSNMINDSPIVYIYGRDGETISDLMTNNLFIADSRNMTIKGNEISEGDGLSLAFVSDSVISNNIVTRNVRDGIVLFQSHNNTLSGNSINNPHAGIRMWLSSGNQILNNGLLHNWVGMIIAASTENIIGDNVVAGNRIGIKVIAESAHNMVEQNTFYRNDSGIIITDAMHNELRGNGFISHEIAIDFAGRASENLVADNTIIDGATGISLIGSRNEIRGNLISHNVHGIILPVTFRREMLRANRISENVFNANDRSVVFGPEAIDNMISYNFFLGGGRAGSDSGRNEWKRNYWQEQVKEDADEDGIGDNAILILPAGVHDSAPLVSLDLASRGLGVINRMVAATITLINDAGIEIEVPVRIADATHERFIGLRGLPQVLWPVSPGILFVYNDEVTAGFTFLHVDFALDIAFFTAEGIFITATTIGKDVERYAPLAPFKYALQIREAFYQESGITSDHSRLVIPLPEGERN